MKLLLALFAVVALCACPQHVDALDGEDATHADAGGAVPPDAGVPPPVSCPAGGPVVTCHADRTEPLLRADAMVTVACDKTGGTFAAPRVSPEGLSVDDRLAAEGKLILKLPASRIGLDFADTTFALDVVAESGGACGTARVTVTYAGNLWVADPSAGAVKAISSDGRLLGDALHGFAEPRLVASVPGGVLVGGARTAGGQTELLVYSRQGQVVRGPFVRGPSGTDLLGSSAPHTATAAKDGTLYVSLGAGDGPGRLLSYSADGTMVTEVKLPSGASPRGVAVLPSGQVVVGVLDQNGGFVTLTAVAPANVIRPAYRDTDSTSACSPSGTVAVLPTDAALFLSTRDPGPWGVAGGLVALSPGDFSLRGYSPHSHGAGTIGALFPKPPDWLAEVSTGVYAAGWAGATGLELFDGTLSQAGRKSGFGGYTGQPAGMTRLH